VTPGRVRVGIWGVFGRGNFGNEATLTAFLQRLDPATHEPVLFCEDPEAASALHGVPARSLGSPVGDLPASRLARIAATASNRLRMITESRRAAGSVDVVVVAGTGGLERLGSGAFGTPFEIWSLARGSRRTRRAFLLLDIGVERLPRRLARYFVRGAARSAVHRSYRDAPSRDGMVASGLRAAAHDPVVTDLAFSLRPERSPLSPDPTVVLGVMDYWGRDDSREDGATVHERYLTECLALVRELRSRGWRVRLAGGDDGDLVFARRLSDALDDGIPVVEARSPEALVREMSAAHVVIASRYHTVIMALLAGAPVLSIGYSGKHRAILAQLGLPDDGRDIESFAGAEVAEAAIRLAGDRTATTTRIDRAVDEARARLDVQWREVEPLLTAPGARR